MLVEAEESREWLPGLLHKLSSVAKATPREAPAVPLAILAGPGTCVEDIETAVKVSPTTADRNEFLFRVRSLKRATRRD